MRDSPAISVELKHRFSDRLRWLDQIDPATCLFQAHWYRGVKRALDLAVIFGAAPVLAPICILCALLIKLESPRDPLLFLQERTGRHGHRFQMYKFRTMVSNAEELKVKLARLNQRGWPDFQVAYDPRITRVGRLLRRAGLDELPQVLNVLRGDMSLVGPRPTSFPADTYALWQTERLEVTPGITGLWQIVGRDTSEFDERSRLDIAYITRRCLSVDIQIIARTIGVALTHLAGRRV